LKRSSSMSDVNNVLYGSLSKYETTKFSHAFLITCDKGTTKDREREREREFYFDLSFCIRYFLWFLCHS
jgi:hypothetical protein